MRFISLMFMFFSPLIVLATDLPVFTSKGVGYYCYQDYADALGQAQSDLQNRANNICSRGAVRVSDVKHLRNGGCSVRLEADFVCVVP